MNHDELGETHHLLALEVVLVDLYAARIGRAEVRRELRTAYHRFDAAPIRSYVMVLTERAARRRLSARAGALVGPVDVVGPPRIAGASA